MKIIVCLDDNNGMMFNNRRQSRDKEVYADIINSVNSVYVSPYSSRLFDFSFQNISIFEDISQDCCLDKWFFIEDTDISPFYESINEIIIYRWNRVYPADKTFDIDFSKYTLISSTEFVGNSHEKITKEIYKKAEA